MNKSYTKIVSHYESCLDRHGDNHLGVDWPNADDAATRYEVMLGMVDRTAEPKPTLLDFGCGAGHLYEYLKRWDDAPVEYAGLDLSEKFVRLCREKFPDRTFYHVDVLQSAQTLPRFDYVVMNGVFTEKRELDYDKMFAYFARLIETVFALTRVAMAFNVMSKHVQWERQDLFHVPFDQMADLLVNRVTPHFQFRNDYGLYEYTTYAYRKPSKDLSWPVSSFSAPVT